MKSIIFICILSLLITKIAAQNRIDILRLTVGSNADHPEDQCGMSPTGEIGVMICGQNCCFKQSLGGSYFEGEIYTFSGPSELGECYNFDLGTVVEDQVSMTFYHSFTDAICLKQAEVYLDGTPPKFTCNLNDTVIDNDETISSKICTFG